MTKKLLAIAVLSLCTLAVAAPSQAQHRRGSAPAVRGGAGPRGGGVGAPRGGFGVPRGGLRPGYRSYHYPRFSFGLYGGYPYYYSPYYYPYGYYGYGYGYPYAYGGYYGGYYPYGGYYFDGGHRYGYGGVQIKDAPKNAQVFADGYYAGTVDDFDGTFQHMNLEPGAHRIEIRPEGQPPISFDVNIQPGETVTYHAR